MNILQSKIAKGDKLSEDEKKILMECTKNHTILNAQIEQGKLSVETYTSYIKQQIIKDQKLLEVLIKVGKRESAAYVKKRIDLMTAELSG